MHELINSYFPTQNISICYGVIQLNKPTGSVKPVNCIYSFALTVSQFSLMLFTNACRK